MKIISKEELMTVTANLLGKTSLPGGDVGDWERFVQHSVDYSWRYHTWLWTLKRGVTELTNGNKVLMPEDFDFSSYRAFEGQQEESPLDLGSGFYLQLDHESGRYEVINGSEDMAVVYQVKPPEISAGVYFPSAVTLAIGASVIAKQGENPNKADISQEWDSFHVELDKHAAVHDKSAPRQRANIQPVNRITRQSSIGAFTGKVA